MNALCFGAVFAALILAEIDRATRTKQILPWGSPEITPIPVTTKIHHRDRLPWFTCGFE